MPGDVLGLCLDTGHALYAGADPAALVATHADRLEHLHVKDVGAAQLAAAHARGLDFWAAIAHGVFCPVGEGLLDLDALRRALAAAGYAGLATSSRTGARHAGAPEDDLRRSVERLRAAGIGAAVQLSSGAGAARRAATCSAASVRAGSPAAASGTPRSQNAPVASSGRPAAIGQWMTVVTSPARASASAAASAPASSARRPRQPKLAALAA